MAAYVAEHEHFAGVEVKEVLRDAARVGAGDHDDVGYGASCGFDFANRGDGLVGMEVVGIAVEQILNSKWGTHCWWFLVSEIAVKSSVV